MASDKQFEIAVAVTSAVAAMIPGLLLFWLEYRRDRERVRVRRVISFSCAFAGQTEWWIDIAIQVTNLSQFPITLTAAGYNIGGEDMYRGLPSMGYRYVDLNPGDIPFLEAQKQLPSFITKWVDAMSLTTDREQIQWPLEIPARTRQGIYAGENDIKGIGIERGIRSEFMPPSFPQKFRIFIKPATRSSMYTRERRSASEILDATRAWWTAIQSAISEMRQEERR